MTPHNTNSLIVVTEHPLLVDPTMASNNLLDDTDDTTQSAMQVDRSIVVSKQHTNMSEVLLATSENRGFFDFQQKSAL
jgi:hypothetical protein